MITVVFVVLCSCTDGSFVASCTLTGLSHLPIHPILLRCALFLPQSSCSSTSASLSFSLSFFLSLSFFFSLSLSTRPFTPQSFSLSSSPSTSIFPSLLVLFHLSLSLSPRSLPQQPFP